MERSPLDHVEGAELARLLEEFRQHGESVSNAADIHPHFAVCAPCREQFQMLALLERQLVSVNPAASVGRQSNCADPAVWREIAGGLTPTDQTLIYIEHASCCEHCGSLLRDAVAEVTDLNGEITEAERNHILLLESARAEWQQSLAQRIAGTRRPGPDRKSLFWWRKWLTVPRLAIAGASLMVVVGVASWVSIHHKQPASASQLLAHAYTEQRTLELRITGAAYAPLRISRGPAASFTSRSEALLKAEALIAGQLAISPSDPSWLQAKAQADLLEGKYDAAVETLRRALELQPNSPSLLIDLATAYFQRAQSEDKKDDLGAAYESSSQALKLRPDDPVALFNRAVVAEHEFLYHQALDDWERYLQVDRGSEWVEEARNHAEAVRERLKEHSGNVSPLRSPAQLLAVASRASEIDLRIDDYLQEAVRSWLPQAFPEAGGKRAPDSKHRRRFFFWRA